MRWIEVAAEIDESPRAAPQPRSTVFDDPDSNQAFAARTLKRQVEIVEQTPDYRIVRTGDGHRGWIMLYNERQKSADYVVQYLTRKWPFLKMRTVTQVIIWRDDTSPHVQHLTERMFFDYLLGRYGAIMSDLEQTPQGNAFWRRRITNAVGLGLRVGIAKLTQKNVTWFDPSTGQTVGQWLRAQDTYGSHRRYEAVRYLIARS